SETRWIQPPATGPQWTPDSPYVWLTKPTVARLGVPAMDRDGALRDEVCALLDIQPAARTAITAVLRSVAAEWRASEALHATRSDEHQPQMRTGPGKGAPVTVAVLPDPELATRLRRQIDEVFLQNLGEQRARLLATYAEGRLDAEFGRRMLDGGEPTPKIYSIQRDGDRFNVAFDAGGCSGNAVTRDWRELIPEHLQQFFAVALDNP